MSNSRGKLVLFFCLAFLLASFFVYVQVFATREAKVFMGVWNVDKLFHILGGLSIAVFLELIAPRRTLTHLIVFVSVLAFGWEMFEYLFLPDVTYFAHHSPVLWRFDVAGDFVAAILGSYGFWVFFRNINSRRFVRKSTQISG